MIATVEPIVPGEFHCPECGFVVIKSILNPNTGGCGRDATDRLEPCPNDGTILRPVKYADALAEAREEACRSMVEARNLKEKPMSQTPSIGRIVHYVLSENDVEQIKRRRTTGQSIAARMQPAADANNIQLVAHWPAGAQAHIGNAPSVGDEVPLAIVRVWPDEFGPGKPGVNGQAMLDGNDVLWVTSRGESPDPFPGNWHWPERL